MSHRTAAALLGALLTAGCTAPARPLDDAALRDVLREHGPDEPYDGDTETGLTLTEQMWRSALAPDTPVTALTFYRRGEPLWEDAGWTRLAAGLDSSLTARQWDAPGAGGRAPLPEYVRLWTAPDQRLVVARYAFTTDSTGYFVTALLTSAG